MKRSSALAPLSRDHHHALVVARELARAAPDHAAAAAEQFVEFLAAHELAHFALEESVLLPALPAGEPGSSLRQRVCEDHAWLRSAMRQLQDTPDSPSVETLHAIGVRLRMHVQMEERELFPYLERTLDAAALQTIGDRLADGDA